MKYNANAGILVYIKLLKQLSMGLSRFFFGYKIRYQSTYFFLKEYSFKELKWMAKLVREKNLDALR